MIWFFGSLVDANMFKTDEKYVAGRLIRTSLVFSSEVCDHFCYEIWCLSDKYQPVLHMIQFFGRYVDDFIFKTDEKFVTGRLIRTSLVLFFGTLWSLLLWDMMPEWQISAYTAYDLFFWEICYWLLCLKLMKNMLQDVW